MDSFVDERDLKILENDRYTFFVLRHVIGGRCKLLLTDHERLILCFSDYPYPVWIWTPDDASEAEMERAYQLASEHSLLKGTYRFNLKYDLAEFFIQRAAADGKSLSVCMNMLAYDCRNPVRPERLADGSLHRCSMEDLEELVDFIDLFQKETGIDQNNRDGYRRDAKAFIRAGATFFWQNEQGEHVASCKYATNGNMASINLVFTRPEFRRKHYAQNLVYQVTKLALDAGYVPMLYTDADYAASNACYEKIGYVLQGKLCTIG
ncbi:MAG: GNAT family N-acetyltransferase [Faecousia sp.]